MKLSPRYDGPAPLSMDGRADDQLLPLTRQRRRLEAFLGGLSDDEWRGPTRCSGWDVKDVIAHLVGVNAFWAASILAGLDGAPTRLLATFDPAAHPPLMVSAMGALTPAEVLAQFTESNDGLLGPLAELDDAAQPASAETPVGHVPIRLLAAHALWDAWIHERDIALPLGRAPEREPDELASCLRYAAAVGPTLLVEEGGEGAGDYVVEATDPEVRFTLSLGEPITVVDGAGPGGAPCLRGDAAQLIDGLSVRCALPTGTPPEWTSLVRRLSTVFDVEASSA